MTTRVASRILSFAAAVVVAIGLAIIVLLIVQSRDQSTFNDAPAKGSNGAAERDQGDAHRAPPPGFRYATDPPTSGPHVPEVVRHDGGPLTRDQLLTALELGDVVLVYGDPADTQALRGVADDVAGPFDPVLAARGQAIILDRQPGRSGVAAVAWRRLLNATGPDDQRLHTFASTWLGHGAPQLTRRPGG